MRRVAGLEPSKSKSVLGAELPLLCYHLWENWRTVMGTEPVVWMFVPSWLHFLSFLFQNLASQTRTFSNLILSLIMVCSLLQSIYPQVLPVQAPVCCYVLRTHLDTGGPERSEGETGDSLLNRESGVCTDHMTSQLQPEPAVWSQAKGLKITGCRNSTLVIYPRQI